MGITFSYSYTSTDTRKSEKLSQLEVFHKSNENQTKGKIQDLIDINGCTIITLQQLHGIGQVLAKRIIEHRPYYCITELMGVPGIGELKYQGFQHQLQHVHQYTKHKQYSKNTRKVFSQKPFDGCNDIKSHYKNSLVIASWNIRHLSKHNTLRSLQKICETINQFDLVALQEVRDEFVLKRMRCLLLDWNYVISPVSHQGFAHNREFLVFFYRKSSIQFIETKTMTENVFKRVPFIGHFKAILPQHDGLEIILVNFHIIFGTKKERQKERLGIQHICKKLDSSSLWETSDKKKLDCNSKIKTNPSSIDIPIKKDCTQQQQHVENSKPKKSPNQHFILLGDFNMTPVECNMKDFIPLIRCPLKTTMYNSLYDNIWLQEKTLLEWKIQSGVYRMDWKYYSSSMDEKGISTHARHQCIEEMSDHRPVWSAFLKPSKSHDSLI